MKNWVVFPSGNSAAAAVCVDAWRAAGWRVAVLIDHDQSPVDCDLLLRPERYPGYVASQNTLAALAFDAGADAVLIAGDDIYPGRGADAATLWQVYRDAFSDGVGVLQATGDRYDAMDWCAPFPLISAKTARLLYGGSAVYHPGYRHFFADQECREAAIRVGRYAEVTTVVIEHRHHSRGHADTLPPEKRRAASDRHAADWQRFRERQQAGFPGAWPEGPIFHHPV